MIVYPGVTVKTKEEFSHRIKEISGFGDGIHVDIMDGVYVPNTLLSVQEIGKLPENIFFEAHLMVNDPVSYFEICRVAGFKRVLVHRDSLALDTYAEILLIQEQAHQRELEFFLAFTQTDPLDLHEDLARFDGLLIMTIVPGFSGQPFIPEQVEEIQKARAFLPTIPIEVDGHVDAATISDIRNAGATCVVSTSFLHGEDRFNHYKLLKGE